MEFYSAISKYYHLIFPVKEMTLSFLSMGNSNGKILDIACGNGGYAIELAKKGNQVIGIDLDSGMIEKAHQLQKNEVVLQENQCRFLVGDMLKLSESLGDDERFNQVHCIGNSIVHLTDRNDIYQALEGFYSRLQNGGRLRLQIINFDRILEEKVTSLPTIRNEQEQLQFIRNYEYNKETKLIAFKTRLIVKEEVDIENTVNLYPLTSETLENMLESIGFKEISFYGSFNNEVYNPLKSYPMIVEAYRS